MSKNYKYPLKVWLTSAFVGTLLSLVLTLISSKFSFYGTLEYQKDNILPMLSYHLFGLVFTLAITAPCWLIFWYAYSKWIYSSDRDNQLRLRLLVFSQTLTWGLFAVVFLMVGLAWHLWGTYIIIAVPFSVVVALSTWFYFPNVVSNNIPR